jgi:hypothetical protein
MRREAFDNDARQRSTPSARSITCASSVRNDPSSAPGQSARAAAAGP